jgi:hypothetical protein
MAFQRLSEIQIIHLHGILGEYIPGRYDMDKDLSPEKCMEIAKNLRITSDESLDHSVEYKRARGICLEADKICFLGFGYHERILDRLGFIDISKTISQSGKRKPNVSGTGNGIDGRHLTKLQQKYKDVFNIDNRGHMADSFFRDVIIPSLES